MEKKGGSRTVTGTSGKYFTGLTTATTAEAGSPKDDATRKGRVSCNRGEQLSAAAAGSQVLWIDATTGSSEMVTRTRPTGKCA
ncbi:hypothetical protein ABCR94_11595 [Streptomyces sp. 21So2-11]|uniref:hypothetical protein n=1 Tax=Streptomyces sp. 21So2-11 TaxID=3144408 RepID=UPI003218F00B